MVYVRKSGVRKVGGRRVGAVRRRPAYRRRMVMTRPVRSYGKNTYTETIAYGRFPSQTGAAFIVQFNQITQQAQYAQLFRQYRINRLTWILVPDWNSYDVANPAATNAPRVVYAIDDTPGITAPLTEAAMLQDNGCKIRALTNVVRISHNPVPFLQQTLSIGGTTGVSKPFQWINTDQVGITTPHGGVRLFVSNGGLQVMYSVYCKINFSLKDPQ